MAIKESGSLYIWSEPQAPVQVLHTFHTHILRGRTTAPLLQLSGISSWVWGVIVSSCSLPGLCAGQVSGRTRVLEDLPAFVAYLKDN